MFFEQYSHEPNIASRRFLLTYPQVADERRALMDRMLRAGEQALSVKEHHFAFNEFLAAGCYTIAGIALYAYTHVAHQGGFQLSDFPAVEARLDRVRLQPGHIAIDDAGSGLERLEEP